MSPRFLACGDLHIGAGRGLYPERLSEQQAVWQRIIDLAAEHSCEAILFAGDAFHRNHPDDDERQAFTVPLLTSSVPVYAINGNSHDWRGHGRKMAVETAALGAGTLTVSTVPEVLPLTGGVSLCTLPWTPVARLVADAGGGDRDDINAYAAELLVEAASGLRARVEGEALLLAHWSISGASLPTGLDVGQLREVVLPLADLGDVGFDLIVAGHIHKPQLLPHSNGGYCGMYVGSPMALDFGEGGFEHGVWLLDSAKQPEFVPVESRPFLTLTYPDLQHEQEPPDVTDAVVWMRAKLTAADAGSFDVVDAADWKRRLLDAGAHHVRVTVDVERAARPSRGVQIADDLGPVEQLDVWLREACGVNGDEAASLVERGRGYLEGGAQ